MGRIRGKGQLLGMAANFFHFFFIRFALTERRIATGQEDFGGWTRCKYGHQLYVLHIPFKGSIIFRVYRLESVRTQHSGPPTQTTKVAAHFSAFNGGPFPIQYEIAWIIIAAGCWRQSGIVKNSWSANQSLAFHSPPKISFSFLSIKENYFCAKKFPFFCLNIFYYSVGPWFFTQKRPPCSRRDDHSIVCVCNQVVNILDNSRHPPSPLSIASSVSLYLAITAREKKNSENSRLWSIQSAEIKHFRIADSICIDGTHIHV